MATLEQSILEMSNVFTKALLCPTVLDALHTALIESDVTQDKTEQIEALFSKTLSNSTALIAKENRKKKPSNTPNQPKRPVNGYSRFTTWYRTLHNVKALAEKANMSVFSYLAIIWHCALERDIDKQGFLIETVKDKKKNDIVRRKTTKAGEAIKVVSFPEYNDKKKMAGLNKMALKYEAEAKIALGEWKTEMDEYKETDEYKNAHPEGVKKRSGTTRKTKTAADVNIDVETKEDINELVKEDNDNDSDSDNELPDDDSEEDSE